MDSIHPETSITIMTFAVLYVWYILRKTSIRKIDIYDFVMLSTVAIIPVSFVLFSGFWIFLSNKVGVAFPFVLLFGILLAAIFLFVHKLTIRFRDIESKNVVLAQELGLLKQKIFLEKTAKGSKREALNIVL